MVHWFYTDLERQKQGPFDVSEIRGFNESGIINSETPVWHEGMDDWKPLRLVAHEMFEAGENGLLSAIGICSQSGKIRPLDQLLPYGSHLVDPDFRNDFAQTLSESGRVIKEETQVDDRYVGFWWRVLGAILDESVKMVVMAVFGALLFYLFSMAMGSFGVELEDTLTSVAASILAFLAILVTLGSSVFYETWMVGRFGATLGKMVIGAKVVNPDESRISYWRSFGRWAAKNPICMEAVKSLPVIVTYLFFGLIIAGVAKGEPGLIIATWFLAFLLPVVITLAVSSVFWMAAFDPEKRALHDRIAATRVIRKR